MIDQIITKCTSVFFTVKRKISELGSIKRLDYPKSELFVQVNNLREYRTRAHSCAKEPETITWIEECTTSETIFYDIGANIGAYSLVAATNGAKVYAFEPAFQNFYTLNKNVTLNNLDRIINCFPTAFSSNTCVDNFVYLDTTSGTSLGFYNKERKFHRDISQPEVEKAVMVFTLDDFIRVFSLLAPTMIKIDVDGAEEDVVLGAVETLRNKTLKTVLIEIDHINSNEGKIISFLESCDLVLASTHFRDNTTNNYIFKRI